VSEPSLFMRLPPRSMLPPHARSEVALGQACGLDLHAPRAGEFLCLFQRGTMLAAIFFFNKATGGSFMVGGALSREMFATCLR